MMDKEKIYKIASVASNIILIVAIIFLSIHLIAPLTGGKLLINAMVKSLSWLGIALAIKVALNRVQKDLYLRIYEYLIICLIVIANIWVWFTYPINLILNILCVICLILSYKSQREKKISN